ncbi:MAG: DUF2029 domain-containing protein [Flavobacteriales bacterium]|nr:DUF2029 domain-containing protein [Flavobacteriales bacterium]
MIGLILLVFAGIKSFNEGMDANVYLYASKQFYLGEDIYSNNPFNLYLYSPFFAALLGPFTLFGDFGRALWGISNMILFFRLAFVFRNLITDNLNLTKKQTNWWIFGTIIISFGMVLHNISLGQITILIVWLTFEGLYQILIKKKKIIGGILLGMGVVIKIIPLLALFYLGLKKEVKAGLISGATIIALLFLPAIYVGYQGNIDLLKNWENTINPSEKYVFEFDNGTYSLNAVVAAYFFDFESFDVELPTNRPRQIMPLSYKAINRLLLILRLILVAGIVFVVFFRNSKIKSPNLRFIWEIAYLCLATALIFPHQQKYAMLYFVPAGSYFLMYFILSLRSGWNTKIHLRAISIFSLMITLLFTIQGRDIIGNEATEFFDDYHTFGLINLTAAILLIIIRPETVMIETNQNKIV